MTSDPQKPYYREEYTPPCYDRGEFFYGQDADGRKEEGRNTREAKAKTICFSCKIRKTCLHVAMLDREQYGVWGAMGEGERRMFRSFISSLGYRRVPRDKAEFNKLIKLYYQFKHQYRE